MAANHLPQAQLPIPGLKTSVFEENIINMWSVITSTGPLVVGTSTPLQGNGTVLLSFEHQPWAKHCDRCYERHKKEMPWSLPQRSIAWWEDKHITQSPNWGFKILEHRYLQVLRWSPRYCKYSEKNIDKVLFQVRRLTRCQWPLRWIYSFSSWEAPLVLWAVDENESLQCLVRYVTMEK